jgi:hypothetical protein
MIESLFLARHGINGVHNGMYDKVLIFKLEVLANLTTIIRILREFGLSLNCLLVRWEHESPPRSTGTPMP